MGTLYQEGAEAFVDEHDVEWIRQQLPDDEGADSWSSNEDATGLSPATRAARSFFRVTTGLLRRMGVRAAREELLRIIGESGGNFAAAVKGSRGGTLERVLRWIERWNEREGIALRLAGDKVLTRLCCASYPEEPDLFCIRLPDHPGEHIATKTVAIVTGREDIFKQGIKRWNER